MATKSALKKALKQQRITIDQTIATSATFIRGGECIQLILEKPAVSKRKFNLSIEVIFEDEYLAAIHKPAGILVSGNHFKTIANALDQNLWSSNLPGATTSHPVHRLDYTTTGILLVGKTTDSIRTLNQLFEKKLVRKTYYAVTIGNMRNQGEIDLKVDGKESCTAYIVLKYVASERFGRLNFVQLKPQTGRKHQLRKHLYQIGNPILGDTTYYPKNLLLKGKGLYLHAYSLDFKHPLNNKHLYLTDGLPKKFEKIFGTITL